MTIGHTDIRSGDWIDRRTPPGARPYLRLMRLDRPIGTWLLLLPGWWAIALAAPPAALPDLRLMALFGIGAVLMRGAGCVVNDILDRDIDAEVERTRVRPIPSGQVSVGQALGFLAALLAVSFLILISLSPTAIVLGVASLALVFPYPLMKRITWWPQAFLGLTLNWGTLMGWAAVTNGLGLPALVLYAAGIVWTLGYDTIYAHQDKEDDARIGVKSSARYLGAASRPWIAVFYALTAAGLLAAGLADGLGAVYAVALVPAVLHLAWQVRTWDPDDQADCLAKFKSNAPFGWLVLGAIVVATLAA